MSTLAIERRAATEADVPFLLELRRRTMTRHQIASGVIPSDEQHQRRVLARYECAEILLFGGRPMGLFKVEREGLDWVLHQIQIEPEFQGRGIGERLIRELVLEARRAGASLYLSVLTANPARRLYERIGFVAIGEGEHEIEMAITAARDGEPR
jgi:ribosomal protein S18 acetylase RimI-like enzyme